MRVEILFRLFVLIFGLNLVMGPAAAADKRLPQSRAEIALSFAPVVKKVAPAVVNIYTKRVIKTRKSPFMNDPFFQQFFGENFFNFGTPRDRVQNSLGSGVIVRSDGIIVTNTHVIDKADQITVVLSDRRELSARVLLADERTDIAVLRADTGGEKLPAVELRNSDDLEVGDLVLAIGNPFGVGQTVTSGIVSAVARAAQGISDFSFFIQTDAAINPGNSGGALVTMDGRVAGINTAIYSKSGGSQGIGFAVPANMVARIIESALNGTGIVSPWFGAAAQEIDSKLAASLGLRRPVGVLVTDLYPNGPAARAGLRQGDVVVSVNGFDVETPRAMRFRIATLRVGETATLGIIRDGKARTVSLPLEKAPETPPRDVRQLRGAHPLSGAVIANMSPALASELSMDPLTEGVIVLHVASGSPAAKLGVRPGDFLVSVNNARASDTKTVAAMLSNPKPRWEISINRDGRILSVVVE